MSASGPPIVLDPKNLPVSSPGDKDYSGPSSYTTKLVSNCENTDGLLVKTFTLSVPAEEANFTIPLDQLFESPGNSFILRNISMSGQGEFGRSVKICNATTNKDLLEPSLSFTKNGMSEDRTFDLGQVTVDAPVVLYNKAVGPYSGLSTSDLTKGVRSVEVKDADGEIVQMASIPLPPSTGAFYIHALESSHHGKPPLVEPGTLVQNTNALNSDHFLITKEDYDSVLKAYKAAAVRDGGDGVMKSLSISFGESPTSDPKPSRFIVSATAQLPPDNVEFEMQSVAITKEEEI